MAMELPPWVRGRVEAEAGKLLGAGGGPVQTTQKDLVVEKVMRKLTAQPGDISPTRITLLVREALRETDEWAKGAQKLKTQLDLQESLEEEED